MRPFSLPVIALSASLCVGLAAVSRPSHAAPADLDLTFGSNGVVERVVGDSELLSTSSTISWLTDSPTALQPDGRIVQCGHIRNNGNHDIAISRYNADGSIDASFGINGVVIIDVNGANSYDFCRDIRVQASGTITAIALYEPGVNTDSIAGSYALIRLTATGQRDATFGTNGVSLFPRALGFIINHFLVLPDTRIAFVGASTDGNNQPIFGRLTASGALDTTLSTSGFITYSLAGGALTNGFVRLADGRFVIGGRALSNGAIFLTRISSDGVVDTTFGTGGRTLAPATSTFTGNLVMQSDGKLVVPVITTSSEDRFVLMRFLANGTPDTSFGTGGTSATAPIYICTPGCAAVQRNDRIVVVGSTHKVGSGQSSDLFDMAAARFNADGTLDASFGSGGIVSLNVATTETLSWAALQPDGKIVGGGRSLRWSGINGTVALFVARFQGDAVAIPSVVEYYNPDLDNFFITADPAEQAFVDSGAVGRWQRTGNTFKAGGDSLVCRFYGNANINPATGGIYGPNSHFYTADSAECAGLKVAFDANAKSWKFESNDFAITPGINHACPFAGLVPVYRAYNNGFTRGVDSNHRITSSLASYQQQVAAGWSGEGIVMCAMP